jgi:arylsulfatase A-like enzyme
VVVTTPVRALRATAVLLCTILSGCGSRPPDVFVLNVDMLRADHVGVYGYARDTTPEIDRLARQGVLFRRAHSHAPWTFPSVVTLLTGLHPTSHGAGYAHEGGHFVTTTISDDLVTLAEVLHGAGYATAAFVTNPLLKRASGLAQGFDVYRDEFVRDWFRDGDPQWWLGSMTAEHVDAAALDWLDQTPGRPHFVYLHYIDVHGPYLTTRPWGRPEGSVPQNVAEYARTSGKALPLMVDLYDGALRYVDGEIGGFVRTLAARGILDHAIVLITADHGDEFGDHGGFGHGHTLYEELVHVPLVMVRTQAFPVTRVVDDVVGQIDVVPTIAELAGVSAPPGLPGRSLVPLARGASGAAPTVLMEMDNRGREPWNAAPGAPDVVYGLLVPPTTKYIASRRTALGEDGTTAHERVEVYDLGRDPGEHANRAAGVAVDELDGSLRDLVRASRAVAHAPATTPMDAETVERLRQLGYVGGPVKATGAPAPGGGE